MLGSTQQDPSTRVEGGQERDNPFSPWGTTTTVLGKDLPTQLKSGEVPQFPLHPLCLYR